MSSTGNKSLTIFSRAQSVDSSHSLDIELKQSARRANVRASGGIKFQAKQVRQAPWLQRTTGFPALESRS